MRTSQLIWVPLPPQPELCWVACQDLLSSLAAPPQGNQVVHADRLAKVHVAQNQSPDLVLLRRSCLQQVNRLDAFKSIKFVDILLNCSGLRYLALGDDLDAREWI